MFKRARQLCLAAALLASGAGFAATPAQLGDFYLAVKLDDPSTVRKLLGVIGDPNGRDPISGETAMILALREESARVLPVLLADPAIDLEATAVNGNTALMMAAFKNNAAAVTLLIDKGARVNRTGWNALHYAAAAGSADIVRLLVARKAEINGPSPSGLTALMLAAREGQDSAVQALLALGADTTLKNNENMDAIQIARRADKERIVEMIKAAR
jgi:ankyrin repeat protein